MKNIALLSSILLYFILLSSFNKSKIVWGFYGHKLINRMAVFTLPEDLIEFYKSNISFITEHAVDPDKRRYAIKDEAIRHYIDLDQYENGLEDLPEDLEEAVFAYATIYFVNLQDTVLLFDTTRIKKNQDSFLLNHKLVEKYHLEDIRFSKQYVFDWFRKDIYPFYDQEEWKTDAYKLHYLHQSINLKGDLIITDGFSGHGILPYVLMNNYKRLVNAFQLKNKKAILKLSADIGHYVGDAHVPLHTTKNYNGQLTKQDGIHAFWESRIPELFAEKEYDFVVGPARYIEHKNKFFRNIIRESHSFVDSLLYYEKYISQTFPASQQYCFEERLGIFSKLPCKEYAKAYQDLLRHQVEERLTSSILDLGSIWTSAWVDAGQPELEFINSDEKIEEDSVKSSGRNFEMREHE